MSVNAISSLYTAEAALAAAQAEQAKIVESLSSGLSAFVESADMYVSESANVEVLSRYAAMENAQMGMGMANVADGALENIGAILSDMNELAIQASNGIYTEDQISALQGIMDQYSEQINNIFESTNFNGKEVLHRMDNSGMPPSADINIQIGPDSSSASQISYNPNMKFEDLEFDISSVDAARGTIEKLESMISQVSDKRSELASVQNGLENSIDMNKTAIINASASRSNISDTEYASQVVEYIKNNLSQEALIKVINTTNQSQKNLMNLLIA